MNRSLLFALVAGALLAGGVVLYAHFVKAPSDRTIAEGVQVASTTPMVFEIADTQAKQELGLGGRSPIPDNYGMLFVFAVADRYGFWMKGMREPIDMVWLSDTGSVLLVDVSVRPDTYPNVFYPPLPVKYVLETRAGYAAAHAWTTGTKIPLPLPYGKDVSK